MNRIDIDLGNGQLKHIANGQPVVSPAYVAPVYDAAKFSQCPVFELVSSTSGTNRNGDRWVVGQDALDFAPRDAVRVGSVPQSKGKAKYALKQLIMDRTRQSLKANPVGSNEEAYRRFLTIAEEMGLSGRDPHGLMERKGFQHPES